MPVEIAVDATHLYWSYEGEQRIGRANLDGAALEPGFIANLDGDVDDVAIAGSHIYWIHDEVLGRADIDGTGVDQSFITSDQSMTSVTADPSSGCPGSGPGRATAKKSQPQKGHKIGVKVTVKAEERLDRRDWRQGEGESDLRARVGRARVDTDEAKTLKLKPKSKRAQERIAKALKQGDKATGKLRGRSSRTTQETWSPRG